MRQIRPMKSFRISVALLLTLGFSTLDSNPLEAQTCTVTAGTGTLDSHFDSEYTENGPGTGKEPLGMPGWTGADSTYSVLLPSGDSAFFFSDSYVGEYPTLSGDGTVSTNSNGLRTRTANCGAPLCNPPTNLFHAHNHRRAERGHRTVVNAHGTQGSHFRILDLVLRTRDCRRHGSLLLDGRLSGGAGGQHRNKETLDLCDGVGQQLPLLRQRNCPVIVA